MNPRSIDLNAWVEAKAESLDSRLHPGIDLKRVLGPELPTLYADECLLDEMLTILVQNAVEAMPEGGNLALRTGGPATEMEKDGPEPWVYLSVEDEGPGIPFRDMSRLFEPFFTTKENKARGSGMGLATLHGILEQHRGRVEICSELGRGTEFRLLFPTARPL